MTDTLQSVGIMTLRMRPRTFLGRACLALVAALLLPAAAAYAAPTWTKVASPNRGTIASALQDVVAVPGTSTAWAVGYYYDTSLGVYRTMTQRYNGSAWSIVTSPNGSSTGYSQLNKVDATGTGNVWAIGYDTVGGGLIERYNGTSWVKVTPPASVALRGIDVVSPTNVWIVGYSGSQATVAQWNNGSWTTRYTLPAVGRHLSVFEGVAVDPAGQVWAVGWDRDYNAPGKPVSSLVVHFDGTTWTRDVTPNPDDRNTLMDVVALGNGDIFTVGVTQDTSGGGIVPRALILREHAGAWTSLAVPAGGDNSQGQLQSVAAVSSSCVWAVGYYNDSASGLYQPLLVHWTAGSGNGVLTRHEVSPPLGVSAATWGVTANASGILWAAGYQSTTGGDRTLILRGTGG
jgi:hypothetical protein